ncbi:Protein of uncharacterised function (DUF459) [Leminorella richardii]|uniref:Protein of uncharacterized function (DUF459) n=1 Tax=Leminorella richardii TaxID=158841 RepID=A0A2X4Y298_9GAMM|nr:SGNH family hydrolase [Leminorella richardii]SQI42834.1 Protein of uncharacterised function (DUF459) [Leminorella richardii]
MPTSNSSSPTLLRVYQVLYILLLTALGLVWLNQRSLSLYWQQQFHQQSPWANVDNPLWLAGGRFVPALEAGKEAFVASLNAEKEASVEFIPALDMSTLMPPSLNWQGVRRLAHPHTSESAPVPERSTADKTPAHPEATIVLTSQGKVLFAGDSMMQGVAPHMMKTLSKEFGIKSINLSKQSTGLAYPGFFNWPKTIEETLEKEGNVELLVVFLGPNDPWDMPPAKNARFLKFKSPEWETLYRTRIAAILESAQRHHSHVIWVGPPNMRKPALSDGINYLNMLYHSEVTAAQQMYISANEIFGYQGVDYSDYLEDGDKKIKLRTDDGTHFTPTGQRMIAQRILSVISVAAPPSLEPTPN